MDLTTFQLCFDLCKKNTYCSNKKLNLNDLLQCFHSLSNCVTNCAKIRAESRAKSIEQYKNFKNQ